MFDTNLSQLLAPVPSPANLTTFIIKVNGQKISDLFQPTFISVHRHINRIPYAILRFIDSGFSEQRFLFSDQDVLSPGNEINIEIGYHNNENQVFKGIIIKHGLKIRNEAANILEIECKDIVVKMSAGRKNKYFYEMTDTDIFKELSDGYNIDIETEETDIEHPHMVQYFVTDWDFMLMRAEANAMVVIPKDNTLIIKKPDFNQQEKFVLNYGTSIYEFEAEMDARDQYPSSKATAWNPTEQEVIEAQSNDQGTSLSGGLPSISQGVSANVSSGITPDLFGADANTDYKKVMGLEHFQVQHTGTFSNEELQKWAEAQYQKSKLSKLKGRVRFEGVADICPGDMINLQNVGVRHSGKVYITAIKHEVKDGRWFTEAQFGLPHCWFGDEFDNIQDKPAANLLPGVNGLQIGLVTKIEDDPQGEDRILVRLPLIDIQAEGVWARIACQDAGAGDNNGRGSYFRPEKDDEVVVGFLNDDPRNAIILGMLNSSQKPAPILATSENHEKGWVTRSGTKMLFNDEYKSVTAETPDGKKILIHDEDDMVQLEDQHGNIIKMNSDGISIESSDKLTIKAQGDIELQGNNVKQSANQEMSIKGNSKASLNSQADVKIKGTFVYIN